MWQGVGGNILDIMYLEKLIIINYKSCKCVELCFEKDYPNVFIGINDCGKSTILKGAELLLGEKTVFNFIKDSSARNDLSNTALSEERFNNVLEKEGLPVINYNKNQCIIIGKLIIEDDDIIDGEVNYTNHLLWAIDQTKNNVFWYAKRFDCDDNTITEILLCPDVKNTDQGSEFWTFNAANLGKTIKELGISNEEIENENKKGRFTNLEKVRAIYSKLETQYDWTVFKAGKNDKSFFPVYRYLNWECSLEDINKIAEDAMKTKIDAHLAPLRLQAIEAQKNAEKEINDELEVLKDSIKTDLPDIEGIKTKIFFNIKESVTDIFVNKKFTDGDIHLESQGDGVKRQIWFALIKSSALNSIKTEAKNKRFIWAFDEPETHLYPSAQRRFFDIIKSVSTANVQTLLSTHSTVFIDKTKLTNIKNVFLNEVGYSEYSVCSSIDEIFESLELRNSDFLFYDKFLVIEGDTELILIPELYKLFYRKKLEDDNIQLVNLKGKNKWLESKKALENVLNDFRKTVEHVVYVFDGDAKFDIGETANVDNMFFIGTQDVEDSIANEVWVNVVNEILDGKIDFIEADIQEIKDVIPIEEKAGKHDKFYDLLQKKVKEKLMEANGGDPITYDILPSKGSEEAKLILRHLTKTNQIDNNLIKAFKKLNK